jgi:tetratricopeptide (TPR) repeat protein
VEQKGVRLDAETFLKQSLSISTSIEDQQLRTTALINLARLYRLRHNLADAGSNIDLAIEATGTDSPLWAEVTYEKALIELATGNSGAALEWAGKSISTEQGLLHGRRLNLMGRILVTRGDWSAAEGYAGKALMENRAAGQAEEEANSLRILGVAAGKQGRFDPGITHLLEALRIDKQMGKSSKIAADLEELSATLHAAGRLKESASYLERAYEVNLAAGRLQPAARNQEALAVVFTALGDDRKAASARGTAQKLSLEHAFQNPDDSSATINPSNSP